jgi:hypothetical protein
MAFPSTILDLAHAAGSNTLSVWYGGSTPHSEGDNLIIDDLAAAESKLGLGATVPARGKGLVGSADGSAWDVVARRNRLVNGDMRVNQRVTMPTTDNSYCLDRWRLLLGAANAATVAQETADVPSDGSKRGCRLTVGSGNNNKFGIFQVLEFLDVADLRGKSVSLQAKIKATAGITDVRMAILEWTGTADAVSGDPISAWNAAGTNPTLSAGWAYLGTPANVSPTTSWATYRVEGVAIGASANNLAVFVWCDDTGTTTTTDILRITDVQLEEGAVCTDVERRPFVQELTWCERYYAKSYSLSIAPGAASNLEEIIGVANGAVAASTAGSLFTPAAPYFRVRMRATPTVTLYNPSTGATGSIFVGLASSRGGVTASSPSTVRPYQFLSVDNTSATAIASGAVIQVHYAADAEL